MNQEITYTARLFSLLSKHSNSLDITPEQKIWEYVKQNFFVLDSKRRLVEKYTSVIQSMPDSDRKLQLKKLIDSLMANKPNLSKTIPIDSKDNIEIALCNFSNDKILFCESDDLIDLKFLEKYPDIEVYDEKNFLDPPHDFRLKHLPSIIKLKKNVKYDLIKIVSPFIRYCDKIEIIDPYLMNEKASINFFRLIKKAKNVEIVIRYMNRDAYAFYYENGEKKEIQKKRKLYDKFERKLKEVIRDRYKIKFHGSLEKGHSERYIKIYGRYLIKIIIPGGFDIWDENGYYINKNETEAELSIREVS